MGVTHLAGFRWLVAAITLCASATICAQQESDLTELSFEELLDIEITSVSRRTQPLSEAAAAVFVITNEDLKRSGATSIPEALRMVPGMQVAQIGSSKWSISTRGFANRFGNKLLVLVDGRTVYTPGFSGVYWEQLDVVLEDVERLEVIRGPGATLWGANAVNGVINVITKKAVDTQGGLAIASLGNQERAGAMLRYGAELGTGSFGRLYAKYANRDAMRTATGDDSRDDWDVRQAGFRFDSELSSGDTFTVQADLYRGDFDEQPFIPTLTPPAFGERVQHTARGEGWSLLGRWERPLSLSSDLTLQVYYDHITRYEAALAQQEYDTFDIDFQHRLSFSGRHNLVWGLGYRGIQVEVKPSATAFVSFDTMTTELWSGFVQDEVSLVNDRVRLTLGSKFEQNDLTGFEYQPNVRALWKLDEQKVVWAAVSRAVRTPSLGERYVQLETMGIPALTPPLNLPLPAMFVVSGNPEFESEKMLAYELGFRISPKSSVSVDLSAFVNDYDNLRTTEMSTPVLDSGGLNLLVPLPFSNQASGRVYGFEFTADWLVRDGWRIAAAYSYSEAHLQTDAASVDTGTETEEDTLPKHQLSLRSMQSLRSDLDLDWWLRYVSSSSNVGSFSLGNVSMDAYWDFDLRLAWRPRKDVELSLVGQNLIGGSRLEGIEIIYTTDAHEVQRGIYGQLKIHF